MKKCFAILGLFFGQLSAESNLLSSHYEQNEILHIDSRLKHLYQKLEAERKIEENENVKAQQDSLTSSPKHDKDLKQIKHAEEKEKLIRNEINNLEMRKANLIHQKNN